MRGFGRNGDGGRVRIRHGGVTRYGCGPFFLSAGGSFRASPARTAHHHRNRCMHVVHGGHCGRHTGFATLPASRLTACWAYPALAGPCGCGRVFLFPVFHTAASMMAPSFRGVRTSWPVFTALCDLAQSQSPCVATRTQDKETLRRHLAAVLKDEVIQPFVDGGRRSRHSDAALFHGSRASRPRIIPSAYPIHPFADQQSAFTIIEAGRA